ncbi:MAG: hypothetical protein ACI82A_002641 [Candidatus Azotimanducaceae bacterium]|jgi:hypothetical protein
MAEEVRMAHPDLRHPFEQKPIHQDGSATVLYAGKAIEIEQVLATDGLWVTPTDLTRINGFELKPEGACFEALCIPLKADSPLLKEEDGEQWFDLVGFADWLEQPYVADVENRVWSFGEVPAKREGMMADAMAPEFEVLDRQGEVVRMSDYKGKKALIITWSSW